MREGGRDSADEDCDGFLDPFAVQRATPGSLAMMINGTLIM